MQAVAQYLGEHIRLGEMTDIPDWQGVSLHTTFRDKQIVVLDYGVVVFFGHESQERQSYIRRIKRHILGLLTTNQQEIVEIDIGSKNKISEHIQIDGPSRDNYETIAQVLGRSSVLSYYEKRISKIFSSHLQTFEKVNNNQSIGKLSRKNAKILLYENYIFQSNMVGILAIKTSPNISMNAKKSEVNLYKQLSDKYELKDRFRVLVSKVRILDLTAREIEKALEKKKNYTLDFYILFLVLFEIALFMIDRLKGFS